MQKCRALTYARQGVSTLKINQLNYIEVKEFSQMIKVGNGEICINGTWLEVLTDLVVLCDHLKTNMMKDGDVSEKEIDETIINAVKIGLKGLSKKEAHPDDMKNIDWNADHVKKAVDRLFDVLFGGVIKEE